MTLTRKGYKNRILDKQFPTYLEAFGAVCVQGPKGCGKTWFSLNASKSAFMVNDPTDGFNNKRLAELDVTIAFQGEQPHLIDEWQDVKTIWDAAKTMVDEESKNGCFILTGSSTPKIKGSSHTGTARMGIVSLRTMSLYESGDSSGSISLVDLFENNLKTTVGKKTDIDKLIYLTIRGGWPRSIGLSLDAATLAARGYVDLLIEDASSLDGIIRDKEKISRTFKSLARNESVLAKKTTIISDTLEEVNDGTKEFNDELEVNKKTVDIYLDIFSRMFLIENQPMYSPNLKSPIRTGKQFKRHLTDPSLAIAALELSAAQLKSNLEVFGYYFEALCERDLAIYAKSLDGKLYHYRDYLNREIDAIVELSDGRWGAIEIKVGINEVDSAAEQLISIIDLWKEKGLKKDPSFLCVVTGTGNVAYRREDGVFVVPITMLKP